MKPFVLYFAHPVNTYDTDLERRLLERIGERISADRIFNPNAPEHDAGYKAKGMAYFFEDILPGCDGCVLLAFRDGKIAAGVYGEAMALYERGCPVWEIDAAGDVTEWTPDQARRLTVEETRARIRTADRAPLPY